MSKQSLDIESASSGMPWQTKFMIVGGVLGALVGIAGAYMYINNRQEEGPPQVSAREGIRLAVLVFGLLRSIATLG